MNIFKHFKHINLTNDQRLALEGIDAFLHGEDSVFILNGYAGSGKTTILKGIVEFLIERQDNYQLMAPTGRATKVVNQKTGFTTTTIHKGIYTKELMSEVNKSKKDELSPSFFYFYKLRNNVDLHNAVFVVDEASMVSDVKSEGEFFRFGSGNLLKDLLDFSRVKSTNSKIIFVGDDMQLPPIGMNFSPALDENYLRDKYQLGVKKVLLREVKRQGVDSGILNAASKLRKCVTANYFNDFDLKENARDIINPSYEDFLDEYQHAKEPKIVITYKNKTALEINQLIRKAKYGSVLPITGTDIIIIGRNNYNLDIMNGEIGIVNNVSEDTIIRSIHLKIGQGQFQKIDLVWRKVELLMPSVNHICESKSGYLLENYLYGENNLLPEEQQALYVDFLMRNKDLKPDTPSFHDAISNDKFFNCISLKFGYAITCHKAQGGEWNNAFVFWDRGVNDVFGNITNNNSSTNKSNAAFYRWAYTAITRASKLLYCINPPSFNSFSKIAIIDNDLKEAIKDINQNILPIEIVLDNNLLSVLKKFGLENATKEIQNHFIKLYDICKNNEIEITSYERVGFELRYYFRKIDGKTAAIIFWVKGNDSVGAKFKVIEKQTNSQCLFDEITNLIASLNTRSILRNQKIEDDFEFENDIEEHKPFLKVMYDSLKKSLKQSDIVIANIEHNEYQERYSFVRNSEKAAFVFYYNGQGFFTSVLVQNTLNYSESLTIELKEIILKLKNN
jgi:hypothetical protein